MTEGNGSQRAAAKGRPSAETQTDLAYEMLEEQIVTLRLEPGSVLSEGWLSKELGFGRTPIREALQRLARENLVLILPRKGILVADINPRRQLLALEVRKELDRLLARAGAVRATVEERESLLEIAQGLADAGTENDAIKFMRYDHALNDMVSQAAHNPFASAAVGLMYGLARRFWYMHYKEAVDLPVCAGLHAELARAIAGGDPEKAAEASDQLIAYTESFTRATLGGNSVALGPNNGYRERQVSRI